MTGAIGDADASTGGGAAPPTPPPPTADTADAGPSSYADVAGACGAGATIGTGAGADGASDTTGTGLGDAAGAALAAGDVRGFGTNGLAGRIAGAGCVDCWDVDASMRNADDERTAGGAAPRAANAGRAPRWEITPLCWHVPRAGATAARHRVRTP